MRPAPAARCVALRSAAWYSGFVPSANCCHWSSASLLRSTPATPLVAWSTIDCSPERRALGFGSTVLAMPTSFDVNGGVLVGDVGGASDVALGLTMPLSGLAGLGEICAGLVGAGRGALVVTGVCIGVAVGVVGMDGVADAVAAAGFVAPALSGAPEGPTISPVTSRCRSPALVPPVIADGFAAR